AGLLLQSERLKRHHGEAGPYQQQAPNVLISTNRTISAEEVELRRKIDRPLRLDGADRQAVAAHGFDPVVEQIESNLQPANEGLVKRGHSLALAQKFRHR